MKKRQKGFTLIEMMLVVGIIAMLTAIIIPRFGKFTSTAESEARNAQLNAIRTQIQLYRQEKGSYPSAMTTTGWGGTSVADTYWPDGVPSVDAKGAAWTYDNSTGSIK